jgi:TonB family protein
MNRTHLRLPLPVYKCPDSGKVTLSITVNQYGTVIQAQVMEEESSTDDYCLHEAALDAALKSRFNSGQNFPERQKGTITYIFASQ